MARFCVLIVDQGIWRDPTIVGPFDNVVAARVAAATNGFEASPDDPNEFSDGEDNEAYVVPLHGPEMIDTGHRTAALTPAQARYLGEIRAAGEKRYNGRARRTLQALRDLGLVEYDFDLVPHLGGRYTEEFTVRPV